MEKDNPVSSDNSGKLPSEEKTDNTVLQESDNTSSDINIREPQAALKTNQAPEGITISWADKMLHIWDPRLDIDSVDVWYIEAYCRSGSTNQDWGETVIPHTSELVEASPEGNYLKIRDELDDGTVVEHVIESGVDEVTFTLTAHNPTQTESDLQWGQPCIRLAEFTGVPEEIDSEEYLPQCFIFLNDTMAHMPTEPWATEAIYIPGQVWIPEEVNRDDANPRPHSTLIPSNGLIGAFSADDQWILATVWEPYQELFQGIIVCLHSDFRFGGLLPDETKITRGKIYILEADVDGLVERYKSDFPEQNPTPVSIIRPPH
jgi:hypothetical protein